MEEIIVTFAKVVFWIIVFLVPVAAVLFLCCFSAGFGSLWDTAAHYHKKIMDEVEGTENKKSDAP